MPITDAPSAYALRVADIESGGNPLARSHNSSAVGLYQFTRGTWDVLRRDFPQLGLTADGRLDAGQQRRAFRLFTERNAKILADALGYKPDDSALYLAHFLGASGAIAVARCPAGAPVTTVVNRVVVAKNPHLRGKTCAQVIAYVRRLFSTGDEDQPVSKTAHAPQRHPGTHDLNEQELARVKQSD
jgi:hypothetical protein